MRAGCVDQIECWFRPWDNWDTDTPWKYNQRSRSGCTVFLKRQKAKKERKRARLDPECLHGYNRFKGWMY